MCKLCDTECSVCSELRKAGDGERDGQTHDQRRAAGQQVTHTSPLPSSSSLSAIFILSAPQTDPPLLCISCYLPFSWFYFVLSGLRTFLSTE